MFQMMLHGFDNHDGIIDHNPDRQYQAQQREVVQAETKPRHQSKRADDGYWYCNQRNQSGSPGLQKQEHDDSNQHDRITQGFENFVD